MIFVSKNDFYMLKKINNFMLQAKKYINLEDKIFRKRIYYKSLSAVLMIKIT